MLKKRELAPPWSERTILERPSETCAAHVQLIRHVPIGGSGHDVFWYCFTGRTGMDKSGVQEYLSGDSVVLIMGFEG